MRGPRLIGISAGLILLAAYVGTGADPGGERPPNILIIVTDDQRVGSMSALPETLRIFEEGGTKFSRAYSTTPQCCPSRASIMTGRYSHNHGVLENNDGDLIDPRTTIQARLQEAGFLTAMAGKYLQGRPPSDDPPFFDRWATVGWGYYNRNFNIDGVMTQVSDYSTDFIADTSISYLEDFESSDDRPWYLYIAPTAPHRPYVADSEYRQADVDELRVTPALRESALGDKPPYFSDPVLANRTNYTLRQGRNVYRRQMRTLLSVDDLVEDVFARLDELDETQQTMAFFISDNGYLLGEHGLFGKRLPYEASIRVPLYVTWPGHIGEGVVDTRLVGGIDLAPTILSAVGGDDAEQTMDGKSLMSNDRREMLLLEQYKNSRLPDWASLLTPGAQYIEYKNRTTGERLYGEFYDLEEDRWQLKNLLRDGDPGALGRTAQAARTLDAIVDCSGAGCP
jgi:arylsulfatase A-like enzyme